MKIILFAAILLFPALAMAQDEGVGSSLGCAEVLAAPPFVDMLTRNDGKDFREISSVYSGRELLGLECRVDELTEFFEIAKWEFLGFVEQNLAGPEGGYGGIPVYYVDAVADFCLKKRTMLSFFRNCGPRVRIFFHEGRISHLSPYISK